MSTHTYIVCFRRAHKTNTKALIADVFQRIMETACRNQLQLQAYRYTTNENLLEDTLMGSLVPPFYKFYKPISDLSARRPAALAFC